MIVTDMEGNSRIYRLPKGRGWYHGDIDRSISASQSVSWNSEGHVESVQAIKSMLLLYVINSKD